ncbi:unnamed protein product [marine sediment metagenome]|uniref:DUF2080 family transposase-associated protein n=1 Tax=marine sediment metagenome TaxID=412755 RepID=X1LX71_9ZZZZ
MYIYCGYIMVIMVMVKRIEKVMKVEIEGYEAIEKIVKTGGNSGRIYVPIQWMNCRVKLIRLDPVECKD